MPQLPFELEYIWTWFTRLNKRRQNGMDVNPLSSQEILAWQARHQVQMDPFEQDVIDRLDDLFLYHHHKKDE